MTDSHRHLWGEPYPDGERLCPCGTVYSRWLTDRRAAWTLYARLKACRTLEREARFWGATRAEIDACGVGGGPVERFVDLHELRSRLRQACMESQPIPA